MDIPPDDSQKPQPLDPSQPPSPSETKNPDNKSDESSESKPQEGTGNSDGANQIDAKAGNEAIPGDNEAEEKPKRDEDRKALADRVSDLRKKETLTDEERQIVADFERTKRKPGRKPKWWHEQKALGIENPVEPSDTDKSKPKPATPKPPATELVKGRVAPPPVFHHDDGWKDKYKTGIENGRELVCSLIGGQWGKLLDTMCAELATINVDPLIDCSTPEFKNMLVLAVDEILPPRITATPAIIGTFATTSTVTQRFLHRKKLAEKAKETSQRRTVLVQNMKNPQESVKKLVDSQELRASPDGKRASDKPTVPTGQSTQSG